MIRSMCPGAQSAPALLREWGPGMNVAERGAPPRQRATAECDIPGVGEGGRGGHVCRDIPRHTDRRALAGNRH
jgi:hypothetical protein